MIKIKDEHISDIIMLFQITKDMYTLSGREKEFHFEKYKDFFGRTLVSFFFDVKINLNDFPLESLLIKSWKIYQEIKEDKFRFNAKALEELKNIELPFTDLTGYNLKNTELGNSYIKVYDKIIQYYDNYEDENLNIIRRYTEIDIMNEELNKFVNTEEFEKAAEMRDKIKEFKEKFNLI
jgi:DNA-directed RNA polymerase beta' subunit